MSERLLVRSTPVPDPGEGFCREIPVPEALAWVRQGAGLVGWGEAARVTLPAGADRFADGEKWLRELIDGAQVDDEVRRRGSGLVAFGSFTFDDASEGSVLIVPRAILGRDGTGNAWLTTITPDGETPWRPAPFDPPEPPDIVSWHDGALSAPEWEQAVGEAVRRIKHSGSLRKVVLARDLYATANRPIDARALLDRLASRYPGCYTFACDGLVGATPELLISRDGWRVSSLVLAGTTPRGATPAEDSDLATALLGSAKENEEHQYAAASLENALAPLCQAMYVAPHPALIRLPNLQHLGTRVRGTLTSVDRSALGLAAAVHPTAAVGGTPTDAAVELIRELESMDRERYAGPVGWVDADGNGEWGIALRCAQLDGAGARLVAGCGIVAGSDPAAELAETITKFRPMRTALEQF
ncbi:MAG TPA: isochorismate synthase [Streptosporangiaceae bacterium]|nr:isochorismate synthase [Streptosporangiaceae bacterium]